MSANCSGVVESFRLQFSFWFRLDTKDHAGGTESVLFAPLLALHISHSSVDLLSLVTLDGSFGQYEVFLGAFGIGSSSGQPRAMFTASRGRPVSPPRELAKHR